MAWTRLRGPGQVGLLLASLLAAMMSTCDAQMIVASGLFTENVYRRYIAPARTQSHYVWVGRLAALVIVAIALVLGTTFTDVIEALKVIIKTPAAIGISMWVGIIWRRWTTAAVWVSSIVAYATWALMAYLPDMAGESFASLSAMHFMMNATHTKFLDSWTMLMYLSTGLFSGVVVSLLTPRESQEKLDRFYRLMRTPVREGEKIDTPCTLPPDAEQPVPKWIDHPDLEIPRPTMTDIVGFLAAWSAVGLIIALVVWLAA